MGLLFTINRINKSYVEFISNELALLEGLARNDTASVEKIYKDNYNMIQSLVVNNNGSTDDAADIFQETMIVLYDKSKTVGFELNCKLKTYIYSISRRLWLKKLQLSQRTTYIYDNTEDVVAVEDEIDLHEKKNNEFLIMEESLAKVGEPCKTLLEEFYIHKKQMQEIAEMFGYTNADNAKTQKYKCLVRLKKLFFQQYKNI